MECVRLRLIRPLSLALLATGLIPVTACETNRVREPLATHLQLWQPGDRYYYGAYAVTDALAEVQDVSPNGDSWFPGETGLVYTFGYENVTGQDATFVLQVDLPEPYVLDLLTGDQVWVTARTEDLWIRESVAEITDLDGNLLLEYYTGPLREELHDLDSLPHQSATLPCGKVAYPRLTYTLSGPLLDPPQDVSLYQGDTVELDTTAGRYVVLLARAAIAPSDACAEEAGIEELAILRLSE